MKNFMNKFSDSGAKQTVFEKKVCVVDSNHSSRVHVIIICWLKVFSHKSLGNLRVFWHANEIVWISMGFLKCVG